MCVLVCLVVYSSNSNKRYLLLLVLLFDSLSEPVCSCGRTKGHQSNIVVIRVPWMLNSTSEASAKTAPSHLHSRAEINTFTPPRCTLLLSSLSPGLMRELLSLAEGRLLTPSRSQMIVFAAWGPDPYLSPDPVTGTVDLFLTGYPLGTRC